MFLTEDEVLIG